MVRLFNVYYPTRTIVLLLCEALIVAGAFLLATALVLGPDTLLALDYEGGAIKIVGLTALALLFSYYFDLYGPQRTQSQFEIYFRLLSVLGALSFVLAGVAYIWPGILIGKDVLLIGLIILTAVLMVWRSAYIWVIAHPMFRERVFVLGAGERAQAIVDAVRTRKDLGMELVAWSGALGSEGMTEEDFASALKSAFAHRLSVDRIILALQDRRGTLPVRALLDARLEGVKVEDATTLLERISGKIQLEGLRPSALIFSDGFRIRTSLLFARRVVSLLVSLTGLILALPLIPFLALAVKFTSEGPILFRQERVGRKGESFYLYKFRTMCQNAEAGGAVWATKNDPRVTPIGGFLRKTRLDEIPQLWNVLKGDMGFVGPRPERPEFVQLLNEKIPYYNLRHIIRPGLTGWAQVRYQYGATLEETRQKLEFDLYYIKHMSLALDLLIMFDTIKTIVWRRGAQ
jgi:sugar transferase (PEP-CTERM system associated)